ncbi:glycosyltransferase [Sulfurimonas sp.]|nr:glycosyltransferase [Sulfurimonas sp.]
MGWFKMKDVQMKFSVIIPTYQSKAFIEKAILSAQVKKSDKYNIEIIIVDDCSPDNTYECIKDLSLKYTNVKLFQQEQNGGPGLARNRGIEESSGDFLFFLDSDDTFDKNIFNIVYQKLSDKNIDIVFFDWKYDINSTASISGYEGRDDLTILQYKDKKNTLTEFLLNKIDCSVIYSAFKKEFLVKNKIFFREGIHEDVDFIFKCILYSTKVLTINKQLYLKNNREHSIINSFTQKHIEGYFGALYEIYHILESKNIFYEYEVAYKRGVINIVASRIIRIYNILNNNTSIEEMLNCLYDETVKLHNMTSINIDVYLESKNFKTKYEMVYEFFIELYRSESIDKEEKLKEFITSIKDKSWSCFDLHNSVFLAPDEIRTCCKRYFHNNEFKGDVVLFNKNKDPQYEFNYKYILNKKTTLFKEINRENAPECDGCPFLKFDNWGTPLENGIKYLSFEYHSVCNMKCTYCSDTYYGGKQASYDVEELVVNLKENNAIENVPYVVWGGGEPTIDKSFTKVLGLLDKSLETTKQRVITNAVKYVPELFNLLNTDKAYIVTSIDAGTEETFMDVRGISKIDQVMKNLQSYSSINPHNIIIKYLLLDNNSAFNEINSFVNLIKEYKLENCNFQISYDFKSEEILDDSLEKMCYLYCLLLDIGVEFIFLDDLVWQRLVNINSEKIDRIKDFLKQYSLSKYFATTDEYKNIIVWGTGAQAELIINKSYFFKYVDIDFFVDPRKEVIGNKFFDKDIKSPNILKDIDLPVFIGAVQSAPLIYRQYLDLRFSKDRIIKKLVL